MLPSFPLNASIAVIGLGYVGLPLLNAISRSLLNSHSTEIDSSSTSQLIGFDISPERITQLNLSNDITNQLDDFSSLEQNVLFTSDPEDLRSASIFIITVPTPVTDSNTPDLSCLESATITVAKAIKSSFSTCQLHSSVSPIIIYESTVYPGVTCDFCIPIIESLTGLVVNQDFFVGYSPERVNPSDPDHRLEDIVKVTSASSPESAVWVNNFYSSFIVAGTYCAPSIAVAEAAKVIENTQRDLNIALINEFSHIFKRLGVNTLDVLAAASTKWNFLNFRPGLVGGHCIGVDPYYLAHCASKLNYNPELILAGRRINDSMYISIGQELVRLCLQCSSNASQHSILLLGASFKENCSDIRNSQIIRLASYLYDFGILVHLYDPVVMSDDIQKLLPFINLHSSIHEATASSCSVVAVLLAHHQFIDFTDTEWNNLLDNRLVYDLKGIVPDKYSPVRP